MQDLVHDFGDGTYVYKYNWDDGSPGAVMVVADKACLAAFYPDDPALMRRRYSLNLAELAIAGHRTYGGSILHLGGSGLSVARGMAGNGVGPHTVVEIDMEKTRWLLDKYPFPDQDLTLIDGDARDHTALVTSHPVVIVDLTIGPLGPDSVSLYEQIITDVITRSEGRCLILSNVHLNPSFLHGLARIALAHPSWPLIWANHAALGNDEGSAILAWSSDPELNDAMAQLQWPEWELLPPTQDPPATP